MTPSRYDALQNGTARLTQEEVDAGWHWCPEMDDLLCIYGSSDCFCCDCAKQDDKEWELHEAGECGDGCLFCLADSALSDLEEWWE